MKLKRSHKGYLSILAVAVIGLTVDRVFLAPGSAEAGETAAIPVESLTVPRPTEIEDGDRTETGENVKRRLTLHLRELRDARPPDAAHDGDPFRVPANWLPEREEPARRGHELTPAEAFLESHRLTAVLGGSRGGSAIVDGRRLRVGDTIDRFRVVAIKPRSVVFERDGVSVELWLSNG